MNDPGRPVTRGSRVVSHPALRWTAKALVAALVLFIAFRLAARIDWTELWARVAEARDSLLAAAAVLLIARYVVWQQRWGVCVAALGEATGAGRRFAAVCASVLVNHATPSLRIFGGLLRARYLARRGGRSFVEHYAVVLYEQIFHLGVLTAILWIAGSVIAWSRGSRGLAAGSLLAGAAILGWLLRRRQRGRRPGVSRLVEIVKERVRRQSHRLRPVASRGRELARGVAALFTHRSLVAPMLLWTLVFGALNLAAQWILFLALGISADPFVVAAVVGGGTVVGAVTGSPGGLATTEAAMTAGYTVAGIDQVDAAAATLLYRGLHYAVVIASGLPALAWFELFDRRRS